MRREVLGLLRDAGPQQVAALAPHFEMARPSFSEHLRVLREVGLVSETMAPEGSGTRLFLAHEVFDPDNPSHRPGETTFATTHPWHLELTL